MHMYHGHCLTLVELRNNKVIIYASKFVHFFSNQTSMHMQCRWWLRPMQQKKLFKLCYSSCKMYSFLYKGQDEKVWWQPSNDCDDKSKQKNSWCPFLMKICLEWENTNSTELSLFLVSFYSFWPSRTYFFTLTF